MSLARWWMVAATLVVGLAAAPSSRAQVTEGTANFELFLGYYFPDENDLDDLVYGARGGYAFGPHVALEGSLERFDGEAGPVDFSLTSLDTSFVWNANPDSRWVFHVLGGPGWSKVKAGSADDSSLTAHFAFGAKLFATDRFYIRPEARTRWYEEGDGDVEWEATVGFGWTIGK